MELGNPRILTINGGSSSIKFALFEAGAPLRRILEGGIERIYRKRRFAVFSASRVERKCAVKTKRPNLRDRPK